MGRTAARPNYNGCLQRERDSVNENELLPEACSVREGGSTENNDRKVGPREREYTRTMPLPSPGKLRCPDAFLFPHRFVVHCHENENEL